MSSNSYADADPTADGLNVVSDRARRILQRLAVLVEVVEDAGEPHHRHPSRVRRFIAELRDRSGEHDAEQRAALLEIARGGGQRSDVASGYDGQAPGW
jgi:hypothetical protein